MEPAKGHSLPLATCHTTKASGGHRPAAVLLRRELQRAACGCWWLTSDQIMSPGPKVSLQTFARFKAALRFSEAEAALSCLLLGGASLWCRTNGTRGGPRLEPEFINKHLEKAAATAGVDVGSMFSGRPTLRNQSALQRRSGAAVVSVLLNRPIS